MRQSRAVERGDEYLPDVSLAGLKGMHGRGRPGKSRDMLQAAVPRKSDNTLGEICDTAGRPASAIHGWLCRLKREGLGRRHDQKSPGRGAVPDAETGGRHKGGFGQAAKRGRV